MILFMNVLTLLVFLSWLQFSLQCGGDVKIDYSAMAEEEKKQRLQDLRKWCTDECVSEWEAWSYCSVPCGKGSRTRHRQKKEYDACKEIGTFTCPHSVNQTSPCNSGCPNGGWISGDGCACKKGYKGQCCLEEIICPYPGRPDHGSIHSTWPAKVDSLAEFKCEEGFVLIGDDTRVCKENGHWSGTNPTCAAIECIAESHTPHVLVLNPKAGYAFGENIIFDCENGYKLHGPEYRTCEHGPGSTGRWSDYEPSCKPVKCPDPGFPENGDRIGRNVTYGSTITFSCNSGFKLVGSASLQCLASGTWFGRVPTCEQITCEAPLVPDHGKVRFRNSMSGSMALFSCDAGYLIKGNDVIKCTDAGVWNATEPSCISVSCGEPSVSEHGTKDGNIYTYPNNVTFSCQHGYIMEGQATSMCQSTGHWSSTSPTCTACPKNTFMNSSKHCQACPSNAETSTVASPDIKLCLCKEGYTGPPGGPCVQVQCGPLLAPENGNISDCDDKVGDQCIFTCNDGYVLQRGSSVRTCQKDGNWEGVDALCEPCPQNTYKDGQRICMPCPDNSHTELAAQMKLGCICDYGFTGPAGGPCTDIDECEANSGRGPCEDACSNRIGSFDCVCHTPGYIVNPQDKLTCKVEKSCRNLTIDDAPEDGGLVCHWYREENAQHCDVKCNPGYDFAERVNDYETCGPTTDYIWSYRLSDENAIISPCIPELFPGFRFEADTSYFVVNCEDLTVEQQQDVKKQFAEKLNEKGVCKKRASKVCDIKDMGIICGRRTEVRRKRGVDVLHSSLDFNFNVTALPLLTSNNECGPEFCRLIRLPSKYCTPARCATVYNRFLKAAVLYAKRQLDILYSPANIQNMIFNAVNREFDPARFQGSDVIVECDEGMRTSDGKCIPCLPGTFLDKEENNCLPCPLGTYQDKHKQTSCIKCPSGFTTYRNASLGCEVCHAGFYGDNCQLECDCVHGNCDPLSGKCLCHAGYEGDKCQIDTPGCRDGGCYPGVSCYDEPAPGTGFRCGPCPAGMTGDGAICMTISKMPPSGALLS